jgi:MYXO-CTERM domain-containing protein
MLSEVIISLIFIFLQRCIMINRRPTPFIRALSHKALALFISLSPALVWAEGGGGGGGLGGKGGSGPEPSQWAFLAISLLALGLIAFRARRARIAKDQGSLE